MLKFLHRLFQENIECEQNLRDMQDINNVSLHASEEAMKNAEKAANDAMNAVNTSSSAFDNNMFCGNCGSGMGIF